MAKQCYFDGDFYQALEAAAAAESPDTHPAQWSRIDIPGPWRFALARLTQANLLELDGQMDKAAAARTRATGAERVGLDELIRREANAELDSRPNVRPPA